MEIPENPVEGLIKFSNADIKVLAQDEVKVEEDDTSRVQRQDNDDDGRLPSKMSRLQAEQFGKEPLMSSQDSGLSGEVSLQDAARPSPKVNELVSSSDLKETADSTTSHHHHHHHHHNLWHSEGIHSPGSVLPMELPSLSDGLHSPDVRTNSSNLSSPGLDSTGLSTPPPPLLQNQHLVLQDPIGHTVHWTSTSSQPAAPQSQQSLLSIPSSALNLRLDDDLEAAVDGGSCDRLSSSEQQLYNQASLNLIQRVSHALDESFLQEHSVLPGMEAGPSLLQPQLLPVAGSSQIIPLAPTSSPHFILQCPQSQSQTLFSSPPLLRLSNDTSAAIPNISPIMSAPSSSAASQSKSKNAMMYRTADGSTVELITTRSLNNRGDSQNNSLFINPGNFQSTPNQPVTVLPSSSKLLSNSPLLPPSHLPSESSQVPPTLFLSSLTRPTNVYSLPAQGLLPTGSMGPLPNEIYNGTPHPILTGRTVLPTPIVSPSAPLLATRSSKRSEKRSRVQHSSSNSLSFATPQSDISYRLGTPSLCLNSSGSEEDGSPPDQSFAVPQAPYNTPVDGVSSSTHAGLPSADYLSAAVLRARCDPDPLDLSATREQHNAKERQRRARIKEACDKLRDLMPGGMSRTDKATLIELCVEYIKHLRQYVGDDSDRDFLKKTPPFLNMCDYD